VGFNIIAYTALFIQLHHLGGCDVDKSYDGPKLPKSDNGKYSVSLDFIKGMLEWFKTGKALPKRSVFVFYLFFSMKLRLTRRRYVWEIILGAHEAFIKEETLVTLPLEEGMTCDVIGDVHGAYPNNVKVFLYANKLHRPILRLAAPLFANRRAK
jgi:serine/threonine-protein phosphatase 5